MLLSSTIILKNHDESCISLRQVQRCFQELKCGRSITEPKNKSGPFAEQLIRFLVLMKNGNVQGSKVVLGRVQNFVPSGSVDHLDYLPSCFAKMDAFQRLEQLDSGFSFQGLLYLSEGPTRKITPALENFNDSEEKEGNLLLSPSLISAASAVGVMEALDRKRFKDYSDEQLINMVNNDIPEDRIREELKEGLGSTFYSVFDQMDSSHLGIALQAAALDEIRFRHGLDFLFPLNDESKVESSQKSVRECLISLMKKAAIKHVWAVIRFCSILLEHIVNSLAPSLSAILVLGKQITLGLARGNETAVYKPLNPAELKSVLYSTIFPEDPMQLAIQQELILWTASLMSTDKALFNGISVIRMGWVVEALKLKLESELHNFDEIKLQTLVACGSGNQLETMQNFNDSFANSIGLSQVPHCETTGDLAFIRAVNDFRKETSSPRHSLGACRLYGLAPTEIKSLLVRALNSGIDKTWSTASSSDSSDDEDDNKSEKSEESSPYLSNLNTCHLAMSDALFQRQMDGCLSRVPIGFYSAVYRILERSPCGIQIGNKLLTQKPTLFDMTPHDYNFVDEVECLLRPLGHPVYRSLFVEAVMVISVILERNSELSFTDHPVDIKSVIIEALNAFRLDHEENKKKINCDKMIQIRQVFLRKLTWPEQDTCPAYDWDCYEEFASTPANIRLGTTSYFARAAINRLLQNDLNLSCIRRDNCTIS